MTYEEAVLYCQFCRYNGYSDWRLPTRDEYLNNLYKNGLSNGWYFDNRFADLNLAIRYAKPVR